MAAPSGAASSMVRSLERLGRLPPSSTTSAGAALCSTARTASAAASVASRTRTTRRPPISDSDGRLIGQVTHLVRGQFGDQERIVERPGNGAHQGFRPVTDHAGVLAVQQHHADGTRDRAESLERRAGSSFTSGQPPLAAVCCAARWRNQSASWVAI